MGMTKTLRDNTNYFGKDTTLIHGEYGCGKTLLAAQFPKPYFLMLENNEAYRDLLHYDNASDWRKCVEIITEFLTTEHGFKTFVIDGIDIFYNLAKDYYIKKHNETTDPKTGEPQTPITSLLDVPFGKGFDAVDSMIAQVLNPVDMDERFNLVLIAHTDEQTVTTFSGDSYNKLCPQLPGKRPRAYFFRLAQNIFYYYYVKDERYLMIRGNDLVMAKNRGNGHFCTTTGEPIVNVPMKKDPPTAYKYLLGAYDNKLKESYKNINT